MNQYLVMEHYSKYRSTYHAEVCANALIRMFRSHLPHQRLAFCTRQARPPIVYLPLSSHLCEQYILSGGRVIHVVPYPPYQSPDVLARDA